MLESHYVAGGAAHTFRARAKGVSGDFCFDSGPSLYGGLSGECTSSPLKHVYQIVGEEPEWIQYDRRARKASRTILIVVIITSYNITTIIIKITFILFSLIFITHRMM